MASSIDKTISMATMFSKAHILDIARLESGKIAIEKRFKVRRS